MPDEQTQMSAAPSAPPLLTEDERTAFLEFIEAHRGEVPAVSIRAACQHVLGIETPKGKSTDWFRVQALRARVKRLIAREPEFAELYAEARGYGQDQLRQTLHERGIEGFEEVVETVDGDGKVLERKVTRKFDNRILALMAKARLPEYADHATVEVRGDGGGAIQVEDRSAKLIAAYAVLVEIGKLPPPDIDGRAVVRELERGAAPGDVPGADVLAEPPLD